MNTILLDPADVLFFRDGRPMGGASSGHGAAWPLPNVINHAFHAALHRAEFDGVHTHRRGRSGHYEETRDRKFGSLVTAGPFPVHTQGGDHTWFFPRPADADDSGETVLRPCKATPGASSLAEPCRYPVVSGKPPSKDTPKPWWSEGAWRKYLTGAPDPASLRIGDAIGDADFSDAESTYGIEISPESGSVVEGQFYSAHYLRLREGWRLGTLAAAPDKDYHHPDHGNDLVRALLNGHGREIVAGGQQRICTATLGPEPSAHLPLPSGQTVGFTESAGKWLVKWVLLTPAIFPKIHANPDKNINAHSGGWLPNWIAETDRLFDGEQVSKGSVLLLDGPGKEKAKRKKLRPGKRISAQLVAAIVGKPLPVTGWALPNEADPERAQGGAKSTHLAVPAGSVYYFECDSRDAAQALAAALNWHGSAAASGTLAATSGQAASLPPQIRNRRSTLFGEKGFGLGVCGTWDYHGGSKPPAC